MKVLFDHQIFDLQRFGGISRYIKELYSCLIDKEGIEASLSFKYSKNEYISNFSEVSHTNHLPRYMRVLRGQLRRSIQEENKYQSIKALKQGFKYEIFHPTYYDTYYLNIIKKPFVITVHDMIHEKYGNHNQPFIIENKKRLCLEADKVIANSQSTKNDILDFYDIEESKVVVTHLAGGFESSGSGKSWHKLSLPENYILFVGNRAWYKNFITFYKAMKVVLASEKDLKVICTGPPFTVAELDMLKKDKLINKFIHLFVAEKDFYQIYKNASIFIFPSEYEGFGIPILEALSVGCPVLASNSSSLPEVGGDAVTYFEPLNVDELIFKTKMLLHSESLVRDLKQKYQTQLSKFSWAQTAKKTIKVYQDLL